jgi:hypothetical protein
LTSFFLGDGLDLGIGTGAGTEEQRKKKRREEKVWRVCFLFSFLTHGLMLQQVLSQVKKKEISFV